MGHPILPTILHFDLDAFFAAVEVLLAPELAGKPLIVGADPRERGVVATASYEARAFGVHSAMPIGHAYRLCPQGIFVRPRHGVYRDYSRRVFAVVERYSSQFQPVSIDEAFVALEGGADPVATARELKAAIRADTGLIASMGLATSKLVSKVASGQGKPDGFVVVPAGTEAAFLAPLPVRELWGVGPKSAGRLVALGVLTIGDLAAAQRERLAGVFGARQAEAMQRLARGEDDRPVDATRQIKSISDELTFQRDEGDARVLWRVLGEQCRKCAARLARHGLRARTVTVKLRYGDFRTITRSLTLPTAINDEAAIRAAIAALMRQSRASDRRPLRLIGVRVSGLQPEALARQLPLFP